jgi:hypothetical protein
VAAMVRFPGGYIAEIHPSPRLEGSRPGFPIQARAGA